MILTGYGRAIPDAELTPAAAWLMRPRECCDGDASWSNVEACAESRLKMMRLRSPKNPDYMNNS
jgi:hypothetical protein